MQRLGLIFSAVLIAGLFGVTPADAARHKKVQVTAQPVEAQPVSRPMARPAWAAPQQCLTDDGYGRFLPCGLGDGR
jgi:hypothetical protein